MTSNSNGSSYSKDYSEEEREGGKKTRVLRVRIDKGLGRYVRERLSNPTYTYNSSVVEGIGLGRQGGQLTLVKCCRKDGLSPTGRKPVRLDWIKERGWLQFKAWQ